MTGFVMFYQFKSFDNEAIMLAASNKRAKLLNCFSNKMFQANPGLFFLKRMGQSRPLLLFIFVFSTC